MVLQIDDKLDPVFREYSDKTLSLIDICERINCPRAERLATITKLRPPGSIRSSLKLTYKMEQTMGWNALRAHLQLDVDNSVEHFGRKDLNLFNHTTAVSQLINIEVAKLDYYRPLLVGGG